MDIAGILEETERRAKLILDRTPYFDTATDLKSVSIGDVCLSATKGGRVWISVVNNDGRGSAYNTVYAGHFAHPSVDPDITCDMDWRAIETRVLPVLRKETVLDDLANT